MINTLVTGVLLSTALSAAPASPADGWQAFSGCWRAENAPLGTLLCVVPDGNGARMLELQDGRLTRETRVVTDAQQRPVSREGCAGTESGRWSSDNERVFLNTDMKCAGAIGRNASAIFALVTRYQWISIQAVTVGTEGGTTVTRYAEVSDDAVPAEILALFGNNRLARETARYAASRALDLHDVGEAVRQVEPRAVEALLLAREQPFSLNARNLRALADARIPSYVIDAMVAVTHPDVFRVEEVPVSSKVAMTDLDVSREMHDLRDMRDLRYGACNSYSYDPWMTSYDARCSRSAYGFGYHNNSYSPWGGYSDRNYYNRPVIIVRGSDADRVSRGRATRNGYSRGDAAGTTGAQPRDRSSGTSTTPTVRSSNPSPSSPSGSSGSSSGSSGSSTGRTAKPKT